MWRVDDETNIVTFQLFLVLFHDGIARCQEAHRSDVPVVLRADAAQILRLPLTAEENARVFDACATK